MRRLLAPLAAALTLAVLAGPLPAQSAQSERGERSTVGSDGIGDPYYPLDGNGGIDVLHYDIDVAYAFQPVRLEGTTTVRLRARKDLTRFNFDLLLPVEEVVVDGVPAAFSKPSRHELRIRPAARIERGDVVEVAVTYGGNPRSASYLGESNWLSDGDEVVTMNEPHMAPWWFPANDHPRDKATYRIGVTTDADKQVISNGTRAGRTEDGDLATTTWVSNRPMATYLAYFAAGEFVVDQGRTDGRPWIVAVSKDFSAAERRRHLRVLRRSGEVTAWLEGELGRYPFGSTGGLVTSLPAGFALENQTRPTYAGGIGMGVQVHEIAHQWFGNSVSVNRWRDIWLNEGFATYLEHRWNEAHGGPSVRAWLRDAWESWRYTPSFWQVDLADPGREISQLFNYAVYERGAMALGALRSVIGRQPFARLLRTWAAQHRHGDARVVQFVRLAERVSGRQLDRFFRVWLSAPRPPARTRANGL